jgi:hypothetical protein
MKVDTWADGQIFSQFLPPDYLAKSRRVRKLGNIDLRALHPLDIVVTKIGRLDERDIQDIQACIRTFGLLKSDVKKRASQIEYLGNVEDFKYHVRLTLHRFFK